MEKVFIVSLDEVSDTIGVNQSKFVFRTLECALNKFESMVSSFKDDMEDWNNEEDYEWEENNRSFEWWESGNYIMNRFAVRVEEHKVL